MSKENVKAFYQLAAKEEGVRNNLVELFKPYDGKDLSEEEKIQLTATLMIPVAAQYGLPCKILIRAEAQNQPERTLKI